MLCALIAIFTKKQTKTQVSVQTWPLLGPHHPSCTPTALGPVTPTHIWVLVLGPGLLLLLGQDMEEGVWRC